MRSEKSFLEYNYDIWKLHYQNITVIFEYFFPRNMWDNMSGFWRMQCADDSFEITAKVRSENLKINSKTMCLLLFSELSFFVFYFYCLLLKYNWNISALFTLPGPSRERKGVANILGENYMFCYFFIPNILRRTHLPFDPQQLPFQDTYTSAKEKCSRWLVDHSEHFAG